MPRISQLFCLLITTFMVFDSCIAVDDTNSQRRSYLFAGMRSGREMLRTGRVVMLGEHYKKWKGDQEFRVPVRYEIVFNRDSLSFRFTQNDYKPEADSITGDNKHTDAHGKALPTGVTAKGEKWVCREIGGTVVHTTAYDLHCPIDSPLVTRLGPGMATGTAIKEWDIQAFGVLEYAAFSKGMSLDEALKAMKSRLECQSADIDDTGISRLKLTSDTTQYELWVDELHGMTPIRISRTDLRGVKRETSRCDVSWKEINGCWVPTTMRIWGNLREKDYESYDLTMEWSHVNEPLDPKLFTPAGITESKTAMVADMRLGQVVLERVIPQPLPVATPKPVAPKPPSRLGWILLAQLIAGGGFAWWYYRRKARRQSS